MNAPPPAPRGRSEVRGATALLRQKRARRDRGPPIDARCEVRRSRPSRLSSQAINFAWNPVLRRGTPHFGVILGAAAVSASQADSTRARSEIFQIGDREPTAHIPYCTVRVKVFECVLTQTQLHASLPHAPPPARQAAMERATQLPKGRTVLRPRTARARSGGGGGRG
eukprot:COSAG01_NODE_2575_length_7433_cov_10.052495_5_plen_168_part_00